MLKRLQQNFNCAYFIETGTYLGETPAYLQSQFSKIFTIELDDNLFKAATSRLSHFSNVECLQGDSQDVLKRIVPQLDKQAMFWLDGHYSGTGTAKGIVSAPLLEELQIIGSSKIKDHVIVIDDISDFSAVEGNIPLSKVLEKLESINPSYTFYKKYCKVFALPRETIHRAFWKKIALPIAIR